LLAMAGASTTYGGMVRSGLCGHHPRALAEVSVNGNGTERATCDASTNKVNTQPGGRW
jgi:hypothetical protein